MIGCVAWALATALSGGGATPFTAPEGDSPPDRVFLAYAGPYSASPASAFGHAFLIMQPTSETPLPMCDVVTFAAETNGAGPLRFFWLGIVGGFQGTYETTTFHERSRHYQDLQDRDLWIVRLRLTTEERRALVRALERVDTSTFPYRFFTRNCASYLQSLLSEAVPVIPPPRGAVSPVDVLELAVSLGLAQESYFSPAASHRVATHVDRLGSPDLHPLRERDWSDLAADRPWLASLTSSDLMLAHEYFSFRATDSKRALAPDVRAGLAFARLRNAQEPPTPGTTRLHDGRSWQPADTPRFHPYSRVGVAAWTRGDERQLAIQYRPALHDFTDPWPGYRPLNTLEFLTVEVTADSRSRHLRLEQVVLFSQRSLAPRSWITRDSSWLLEAEVARGGVFARDQLHTRLRLGQGRTWRTLESAYVYGLVTTAMEAAGGHGVDLVPGVEVGTIWLMMGSWRSGAIGTWGRGLRGGSDAVGRAWIRRDLGRALGITLVSAGGSRRRGVALQLDFYPD